MIQPSPIHHFLDRILLRQHELNGTIKHPRVDQLALLLLSQPIQQINDTLIMEYWIVTAQGALGFFSTMDEAVLFTGDQHL
ncbi:hypothetical protein [Prosthecobacter sp.]|jgi:hypothetical protein|uniref:hypothetical protein n=1 Tax=Prosthecobacter sp. TaxID=1965333 RepID=UPI0037CAAD95